MKILKITTVYPVYLNNFYDIHSNLVNLPYLVQKAKLDYDAFGWSDFWSHALAPLGFEMMEVTANAEALQKSWAIEMGIKYNSDRWLQNIAFQQVLNFKPVILFMDEYSIFTYEWLKEIRQACPSIRLVIGWCGAPYEDVTIFKAHDLVLSCIPELVEQFRGMGHFSEHINHAFDPRVLDRVHLSDQPNIDFSFVGQIVRGNQYHSDRERILEELVSRMPVEIYSPSAMLGWKDTIKTSLRSNLYKILKFLKTVGISQEWLQNLPKVGRLALESSPPLPPVSPLLLPFIRQPVFGLEMFQTLRNSKVTFNNHINISPHSASNMRLFEATGIGTCLITDWKNNITNLFEPDQEIVTYTSSEDCYEKVQWLLNNPQQRFKIAQAGQARTLRDHTFQQRAIQLVEVIKKCLS
jgi:spore maturation protein CgeB